ncbi:MAG: hypothetical protein KAR22_23245 [Gammaproteobacteria bacterium]|nr:hypothetical protein [Gammaproteobacteria bacterium]
MKEEFIFWKQELRVSGPCDPRAVAGRIRSLISVGGLTVKERLIGAMDGDHVRVWRTAPLAQAGDVVEFRGVLRAEGDGSAIDGTVGYNLRTKFQFVGCLVLGLFLTAVGLFHWLEDLSPGLELVGVGLIITVATLLWIYSSRKLTWKQVAFIEDELARSVAA